MIMEGIRESSERSSEVIDNVLARLRELHATSAMEKSDEDRILEGMSNQIIGATTLRACHALIDLETRQIIERSAWEQWELGRTEREVAAMKQQIIEDIFKEHWYESTLSTLEYPIHAATYGTSKFRYDLRMLMTEQISPETLDTFAWIMFDANGLRSFKDCTSHQDTTDFLRGAVRILTSEASPTRRQLEEQGIRMIPMATGGDEFVLYLRGNTPIDATSLGHIVASFQEEITRDPELNAALDFNDERALVQFGMPSSAERKEFEKMPAEARRHRLAAIRTELPDRFIPSFAGGGALLSEGILRAIEKDEFDLMGPEETFTSLREKIIQATVELAENRQKKHKEADKAVLQRTNPALHAFFLRNSEARKLEEKTQHLERENMRIQTEMNETRAQLADVLAHQEKGNHTAHV